jgi:hypothetical protein
MESNVARLVEDNSSTVQETALLVLGLELSNEVQERDCLLEATASLISEMEAYTAENKRFRQATASLIYKMEQ